MTTGDRLLDAIQQEPDNDELRLVYADWLYDNNDPDRAEFIRVQIEALQHFPGTPEHKRRTDRAVALLNKHGTLWASGCEIEIQTDATLCVFKENALEDGIVFMKEKRDEQDGGRREVFPTLWFRRGFVDEINFTPHQFFSLGPSDLRPTGPLPTLTLEFRHWYDPTSVRHTDFVSHLVASPLLQCFRDVRIVGGFSSTTPEDLRLLAREPTLLAKLRGLYLSEDPIGDAEMLPILESPHLTRLRELTIDGTDCTAAVLSLLLNSERFRGMRYLNLSDLIKGSRGIRFFSTPGRWSRLRQLSLGNCGLDDLTLRGLLRPRAFPVLEMLDLADNAVHHGALRALLLSGTFPRLRLLGIGGTPLTLDEVQALRAEFGQQIELYFPVPRQRSAANQDSP